MRFLTSIAIVVGALIIIPEFASAQAVDIGKSEYTNNCAVCHGVNGKGNGPMAVVLTTPPTDLTTISKRNGGVFPFARVYQVIDGSINSTQMIKAHGTREMPIWGQEFSTEAWKEMYVHGTQRGAESIVQGRIVALIGYIHGLQSQ